MVVLSVLDMVPPHDLDLSQVCILFPLTGIRSVPHAEPEQYTHVEEVDFLEELLLMILELADHDCRGWMGAKEGSGKRREQA